MSAPEQTTTTELQFSPETLHALGQELFIQLGQLNPIQRDQIIQAAGLLMNQPGRPGAPAALPEGLFAPVNAATRGAANMMSFSPEGLAPALEALQGGVVRGRRAATKQAGEIGGGITSFVDPRFATILSPTQQSQTSTSGTEFQTGLAAAGTAGTLAGLAVAL
jgi:hypothetical protein